jgi:hypothetical protein
MNSFQVINPTTIEHEGFYYLEYQGEFFKGCKRCGGEGHYSHNGEHSRCYECDNTSAKLGESLGSDRKVAEKWCHERAVRRAQRIAAAERKRLIEVAKLEAKVATLPEDVRTFLLNVELNEFDTEQSYYEGIRNENYEKDAFIRNMAEQVQFVSNAGRPFTDKMVAAVRSSLERRAAKQAEAASHPAPTGRVVVTGEVVGTKTYEGDYGTSFKVTVKDDQGFRVFVSIPGALADELAGDAHFDPEYTWFHAAKGRRITFTATLEPSTDDVAFAFGKRPTKGAWL